MTPQKICIRSMMIPRFNSDHDFRIALPTLLFLEQGDFGGEGFAVEAVRAPYGLEDP
jgi:hypothetical protein